MDPRYAKAKCEEPFQDLPFHLSLLKPNGTPIDDFFYLRIFEDPGKYLQLTKAIDKGEVHARKLHRIRNKELVKFIKKDFEGLKDIQVISEAAIGVIADAQTNRLSHSFLDLLGTVDEVKLAEELIIDAVLKTYNSVCFPIILMRPQIHWDKINIHLHKVCRLLGTYGSSLLRIESESGAWIQIEQGPSPGVGEWERVVNIYGTHENVNKAKSLVQSAISDKPGEQAAVDALNEFLRQFREPSCVELIDHKKNDDVEPDKKKKQKVGEHSWNQTFLPTKKSEGESSEEKKKENEFKEPSWIETFGQVICVESDQGNKEREEVKDKEDSGAPEKDKEPPVQAEEGGSVLPDLNAAAGC